MSKMSTDLESRFCLGERLLTELRANQLERLTNQARLEYREEILKEWIDLGKAERGIKQRYRGRFLFELIQNANDALLEDTVGDSEAMVPHKVRIELSKHSLVVANYGQPFSEAGVRALCRLHFSTKEARKQIGHKGIGFKSVLEISTTPEIYSGVYAFCFNGERFRKDVGSVMGEHWQDVMLPTLRTPFPCDFATLPDEERKCIERLLNDGYSTIIRLPLSTAETGAMVESRMRTDITATLLLFMTAISQIELQFPDGKEIVFRRARVSTEQPERNEILLYEQAESEEKIHSHWLVLGPHREPLHDLSLLSDLDEDSQEIWRNVSALCFSLAFPLTKHGTALNALGVSQPFYVYFPTEEPSGLSYIVHADFHVGDDRKTLDDLNLNRWLAQRISTYIAGEGLEHLKSQGYYNAVLVEILAPVNEPQRAFARTFMSHYLECLSGAAFVPVEGDKYRVPREVRFPPEGVTFETFKTLFPSERLQGTEQWAYPTQEVLFNEEKRERVFLLRNELGVQRISSALVIESLISGGMPSVEEGSELIAFLAEWFHLRSNQDTELKGLLRKVPIFPTVSGWEIPGSRNVFQANLRGDTDDVVAPEGFEFAVIRRDVYPVNGTTSAQYRLFEALGALAYTRRAIVQSALIPVLTDLARLQSLLTDHPKAIFEAYELLKQFFEEDLKDVQLGPQLAKVLVPAWDGSLGGWRGWKPASACYFGPPWEDGEVLLSLYSDFSDCYFLEELPVEGISENTVLRKWQSLFRFLGVKQSPKVYKSKSSIDFHTPSPFTNATLWELYIDNHNELFVCLRNPHHGRVRRMEIVHTIHHWEAFIKDRNTTALLDLYTLIAKNWKTTYQHFLSTTVKCSYTTTRCDEDEVEDFLLYQLKQSPWVPAQVDGTWTQPLPPTRIWILGETDPVDVRRLVPTLPVEWRGDIFQTMVSDLGFVTSPNATIEDYIKLLELIPERYPLADQSSLMNNEEQKSLQRSVQRVVNWAWEHIQRGLIARGENGVPIRPNQIKVLAEQKGSLCYVDVTNPHLVYADDGILKSHWAQHCIYFLSNENWQRLRNWLQIPNLSDRLVRECQKGTPLQESSEVVTEQIKNVFPYFLTLVKQSQESQYPRIMSRLQRLKIEVFDDLTVIESLRNMAEAISQRRSEPIYLSDGKGADHKEGASGIIYLTEEGMNNPYPLGAAIANYIGIAHLADSFAILYSKKHLTEREQYLVSKGISHELINSVFEEMQLPLGEEEIASGVSHIFLKDLIDKSKQSNRQPTLTPDISPPSVNEPTPILQDRKASDISSHRGYPSLRLDIKSKVTVVMPVVEENKAAGGYHGGVGGVGRIPDKSVTEELGRRGEQWAYEAEKERLRTLGFNPEELEAKDELIWMSDVVKNSNFDIQSVTLNEDGALQTIYIEVKATSGSSRDIHMSLAEFELALSQGDAYYLYWVSHVETEIPKGPFCFQNFAELLKEKQIVLNVETLTMRLPKAIEARSNTGGKDA